MAVDKNYKVQVAKKQEDIAIKNNTWSEAGAYPTVTLNVGFNNNIQDNTNNPFTFTPGVILSTSFAPNLSLNYNIFSGFAVKMSKERLEQLEAQSNGNALVIIESTIQDVLKAYYTAKLQEEKLKLLKEIKANSSKRLKYYEVKDKYAKSSSLELLQFKNQYLTDSTNYLLQEISYRNSLRNLLLLMNNSEDPSEEDFVALGDSLNIIYPELDLSQAKSELKSNNQQLKNQYIALELQKTVTEYQRSFLYPTLSFQGGVSPTESWLRNLNNSEQKFNTQVINYSGNLNLRYSLFNNWKNKRAVEVSQIQEEIATLNSESLYKSLAVTLSNLSDLFQIRKELVNVSEQNYIYATKAWELAQKRFENGTLTSFELLSFQNAYQNTLIQHFDNQFNKLDTFLEIYKITGKLALEYKK
jgi:outer membrane protein TolC